MNAGLSRQVSCVHGTSLPRHTATNHTDSLSHRLRLSRCEILASPFTRRLAVLPTPNHVHYRCGLSGSFRCSPPRLATTQLLQVLSPRRTQAGRGLPPRKDVTLHSARVLELAPAFLADKLLLQTAPLEVLPDSSDPVPWRIETHPPRASKLSPSLLPRVRPTLAPSHVWLQTKTPRPFLLPRTFPSARRWLSRAGLSESLGSSQDS